MGKMGVPAARIGREKVDSDYSVRDLTAEGEDPAWIAAGEDSGFELEISNNAGSRDRVKSKAISISKLTVHICIVQKWVQYQCNPCHYFLTRKGNLIIHMQ